MNNSFSLHRLWLLVRKQGIENARFYLLGIAGMTGLLLFSFAFLIIMLPKAYPSSDVHLLFFLWLYIIGAAFTSLSFKQIHIASTGSHWLTQPASALEKLLCTILYTTVIFTVVYLICFFVVQSVVLAYVKHLTQVSKYIYQPDRPITRDETVFIYSFLPFQTFFLAGSAYFKKYAFLKTAIATILTVLLSVFYYKALTNSFLGEQYYWTGNTIRFYTDRSYTEWKEFQLAPGLSYSVQLLLQWGLPISFCYITWFRLKEKQL
jgi:hypothetical protein